MSDSSEPEPLRLGIVGCGVIGQQHLNGAAATDAVDVAALADLDPGLLERVGQGHRIDHLYTDASDLMKCSDVEAVVLALPAAARRDLTLDALAAGKHVLMRSRSPPPPRM